MMSNEQIGAGLEILAGPVGRGKGRATIELIEASLRILEEIQPATIRAVCYQLFNRRVIPDMGRLSTNRVSRHLTGARESGDLPWSWIVDETREAERISSWDDPTDYIRTVRRSYRKDLWLNQPKDVEVWSEKGTVRGTLKPVLDEYGVTFRVMHGFASATALHQAADDSWNRPFIVLYVGDCDPSGMHMSEVDIPNRLQRYEAAIDVRRIALRDCDTDDLPSFDLASKKGDRRHDWFKTNYGNRCWELDAMSPVDLRARVEDEIKGFIDWDAWELSRKTEAAEVETIDDILGKWRDAISGPNR